LPEPVGPTAKHGRLAGQLAVASDDLVEVRAIDKVVVNGIGDFGTGLSSIGWLRRCPLDELKIDRSLIGSVAADRASCDIVQVIVELGRNLKLRVIAEGVENIGQLELLKKLNCEFGQGYFFSQPVDAKQAEPFLQPNHSTQAAAAGN